MTIEFITHPGAKPYYQYAKRKELVEFPERINRDGFLLDAWYIESDDDKEIWEEWDFDTELTRDITLHARWLRPNEVAVRFADHVPYSEDLVSV